MTYSIYEVVRGLVAVARLSLVVESGDYFLVSVHETAHRG